MAPRGARGPGGGNGPNRGGIWPGRGGAGWAGAAASSSALPQRSRRGFFACSASRSRWPSPPPATWRGPFVWAAPLCPYVESPPPGSPPGRPWWGPVPGDPVTVTGSGQSPFFKPVLRRTSASRPGRAEARSQAVADGVSVENPRGYCLTLKRQPRAASGPESPGVFLGRGMGLWKRSEPPPWETGKGPNLLPCLCRLQL